MRPKYCVRILIGRNSYFWLHLGMSPNQCLNCTGCFLSGMQFNGPGIRIKTTHAPNNDTVKEAFHTTNTSALQSWNNPVDTTHRTKRATLRIVVLVHCDWDQDTFCCLQPQKRKHIFGIFLVREKQVISFLQLGRRTG